jgi:redox-sensitive bicupin YhaK (pirin superfamily)
VLPAAASAATTRTLYVFEGAGVSIDGEQIAGSTGAVVRSDVEPTLTAVDDAGPVEALMLQGRPIGEPVAQYGPFVMNTRAEIQRAFDDYQRTRFGGWPWDRDDPVHGVDTTRFAHHATGLLEHAVAG